MRYSIELKDRIYVKGYGLLSFAKNLVTQLSSKYGQKLLDSVEKSVTDEQKGQSKKQQKQLVIKLVIKLLIKSEVFLKILRNHKIMKLTGNQKHQKKGTYLYKNDNKLLIMHQIKHLNLEQKIELK